MRVFWLVLKAKSQPNAKRKCICRSCRWKINHQNNKYRRKKRKNVSLVVETEQLKEVHSSLCCEFHDLNVSIEFLTYPSLVLTSQYSSHVVQHFIFLFLNSKPSPEPGCEDNARCCHLNETSVTGLLLEYTIYWRLKCLLTAMQIEPLFQDLTCHCHEISMEKGES